MLIYQVVYDRRSNKHRIRRRTVRVEKGQLCWPGPPALWPSPASIHKRLCDVRAAIKTTNAR